MQDLTIIRANGNIVRSLAGEDHISGLVFYSSTLPVRRGSGRVHRDGAHSCHFVG